MTIVERPRHYGIYLDSDFGRRPRLKVASEVCSVATLVMLTLLVCSAAAVGLLGLAAVGWWLLRHLVG